MADSEQASAPPAPPPRPATLGEMLRTARLTQDLTVEQLATELRIEAKQLNALEENRFEQIGVPVFVKGYLKQYGLRLGLDVKDLLALYTKQTTLADVQIQPSRTIKLRDDRQIASWILAAIVLLVVIVGLAVWWWNGGTFGGLRSTRATDPPAPTPAPAEVSPPQTSVRPVTAPAPATVTAPPPATIDAAPAQAADLPPAAAAAVEPADASDDARAAPAVAIPLQLVFDSESWAEITDARGERLLFGLNAAGRSVTVSGEPPFAIVLGNADSVRLTVDGEPYAIPQTGRQGNLARFAVDIAEE
jgi:cytoskeleton protein RodZ